jgi:predicted glycoside hydrolase/deacetylase ChbG (UPF0249 family)
METLAERLGHSPDTRILIVNCDDLGFSHAANEGVFESLSSGIATSATLMVPAPWSRDAAARYRGEDIGVHLTLNAEYDLYRWGPITHAPSLLDGDGGFPRTVADVWEHADLDEVRRECRAQIDRAVYWGFDVSHIDSHLGTLIRKPEFFDVYLDLAEELRLPLRLPDASGERSTGFPYRQLAAERGVVFPDHFLQLPSVGSRATLEAGIRSLEPGVTEAYLHPALDTPELRAMTPDWELRVDDFMVLVSERWLAEAIAEAGIVLTGYRQLRELMRPPSTQGDAPALATTPAGTS